MNITAVAEIMLDYAGATHISPEGKAPQRYLWTDAFALCNFLDLYRQTQDDQFMSLALLLVEQVHTTLGRWRPDDSRVGRISGLDESEGAKHPTRGGLRIGKEMMERRPEEAYNPRLEWDRDGQYYHYLTQWMHALACLSRATGNPVYNRWAIELAQAAHAGFTYELSKGNKLMYWKMSTDLSYPLVSSMGHHDPLDGLITYCELQATAGKYSDTMQAPDLSSEIADMAEMCAGKSWATDDPLGIGGMLGGAYRMAQLIAVKSFVKPDLLKTVLDDAVRGMDYFAKNSPLDLPAAARLAFRELGLSIGLQSIMRLQGMPERSPGSAEARPGISSNIQRIIKHNGMIGLINSFWLDTNNQKAATWIDHRNINMVMLATSLSPDGYLNAI
jgi:hypothetical protein